MATSNATANMCRRQAFTGKGITFIEMMFDDEMVTTSTTPDTKDSVFNEMSKLVGTFGTIIAQSYALGCKCTEKDAALATSIIEDELCDYLVRAGFAVEEMTLGEGLGLAGLVEPWIVILSRVE